MSYFLWMLEGGFYFVPSQIGVAFVSTIHSDEDIYSTIEVSCEAKETIDSEIGEYFIFKSEVTVWVNYLDRKKCCNELCAGVI